VPIDRDLLGDQEDVLVDLRPHWVFLFGPAFLTLVALAAAVAVASEFPRAPVGVAWVLVGMVLVPAIWLAGRLIRWAGMSLTVTTQRLILRRGLLGRDLVQLRLQRITEIHSTQTPLERLIGTGRLLVEVEGEDQAVAVDDVRRPRNLQRVINNQLDEMAPIGWRNRWAPIGSPAPVPVPAPVPAPALAPVSDVPTPPHGVAASDSGRLSGTGTTAPNPPSAPSPQITSVPQQLIQLDELRRRGIVTPAEFEAKKAELLGRL
jgi:membrane protein YdbS with pleckstrin-like domain